MPGWIGPWELLIVLVLALVIFGPKRLPEMGRSLGKGLREFKSSVSGKDDDNDTQQALPTTMVTREEPSEASTRDRDTVA
jgi:sec-independent protein translocase protein TatA